MTAEVSTESDLPPAWDKVQHTTVAARIAAIILWVAMPIILFTNIYNLWSARDLIEQRVSDDIKLLIYTVHEVADKSGLDILVI